MAQTSEILKLEDRGQGVVLLWMDDPAEPVNTLKRELIDEFDAILTQLESMPALDVLVFASGKADSFIAGANLDMLLEVETAQDAQQLSTISQSMQNRIAALPAATVAAIHGPCLGGGLEVVLAFDYRLASDDRKTRLGLPEVQLGVLPGGGGTQRLPRLTGIERALDLLLTGRQLAAQQARSYGLVDQLAPPEVLVEAAIEYARSAAGRLPGMLERLRLTLSPQKLRQTLLAGNPLGRKLVFEQARKRAMAKTRGNYPAPEAILEVVRTGLDKGLPVGLNAESRAFGTLVVSPQAKQLINLFFANNTLKKETGVKNKRVKPRPVNKIGVLGAGLMGAGIAYVSLASANTPVRIKDRDGEGVGHGLGYVRRLLDRRVRRGAIKALDRDLLLGRLSGTMDYAGLSNCDVIVEAVFENLELKQQVLRDIEQIAGQDTIFASNTSAIPIGRIAATAARPENILGMHYFSPVEKMPLLEIVVTEKTAARVTATCVELGKRQGKTVIVVNDGPGFYTTRILGAYVNEAAQLLSEGVAIDRIDAALMDFGFPVGPMALLDEVGIDVGQKVASTLHSAFGERLSPAPGMARLLDDDRLGRKNSRGLYRYDDSVKKGEKKVDDYVYRILGLEPDNLMSGEAIADRCALRMVNEAAHCLGEGIIRSPRDGDIGAVFGLGFPPFRGGPFRYVDGRSVASVRDELMRLADRHGPRFAPAPVFEDRPGKKTPFYP